MDNFTHFTNIIAADPKLKKTWDEHQEINKGLYLSKEETAMIMGCFVWSFKQGYAAAINEIKEEFVKSNKV